MQRLGYTVIRFTGTEIINNVSLCVEEVVQYIRTIEDKKRNIKSIFIDLPFLTKATVRTTRYYRNVYPEKDLQLPPLSALLKEIANLLKLNGNYDVYIFGLFDFFSNSMIDLDVIRFVDYSGGILTVYEEHVNTDMIIISICDYMKLCKDYHDEIVLVGDDQGYVPFLKELNLPTKLMRRNNYETSMVGLDVKLQDIDYAIASVLGLARHEW